MKENKNTTQLTKSFPSPNHVPFPLENLECPQFQEDLKRGHKNSKQNKNTNSSPIVAVHYPCLPPPTKTWLYIYFFLYFKLILAYKIHTKLADVKPP